MDDTESEEDSDGKEDEEESLKKPDRMIIIDISLLQRFFNQNLVCKKCHGPVTIFENTVRRQGLATRLLTKCDVCCPGNSLSFYTSERMDDSKTFVVNKMSCLGLRAIGRGHTSAQKLFFHNEHWKTSQP